jgi:hypothetical protein
MDRRTEDVYRTLFERNISLSWTYQIDSTQLAGNEATVTCSVVVRGVDIRNQPTTSNRRYRLTMRKADDRWRITRMDVL